MITVLNFMINVKNNQKNINLYKSITIEIVN